MAIDELPETASRWEREAKRYGLTDRNIHNLPDYKSASKIKYEQYLCLRVLWRSKKQSEFKPPDWLSNDALDKAGEFLKTTVSWLKYLEAIHANPERMPGVRVANIGAFSLVRYHQLQVLNLDENNAHNESPKFSPIARRTRSKMAKRGLPDLFATPSKLFRK